MWTATIPSRRNVRRALALLAVAAWLALVWACWPLPGLRLKGTVRIPGALNTEFIGFSRDAQTFATCDPKQRDIITIWNLQTLQKVETTQYDRHEKWDATTVRKYISLQTYSRTYFQELGVLSRDGKTVAKCDNGETSILDLDTGEVRTLPGARYRFLAFSAEGRALMGLHGPNRLMSWDLGTGQEQTLLVFPFLAYMIVFSPDGRSVAAEAADGPWELWDIESKRRSNLGASGFDPRFSPDGKTVAVIQIPTSARLRELANRKAGIAIPGLLKGYLRTTLLDVATGRPRACIDHDDDPFIDLLADSDTLASISWRLQNGMQLWTIPPLSPLPRPPAWPALAAAVLFTASWWYARRRTNRESKQTPTVEPKGRSDQSAAENENVGCEAQGIQVVRGDGSATGAP